MPKGRKKGKKKAGSLVAEIRSRITSRPGSGDPTGTGGKQRSAGIDAAVEAMQTGVSEANKRKKR